MRYKGKSVEIIGGKTLFGKETLWVHALEDNTFMQVLRSDLVEDDVNTAGSGMAYVRYVSIAARIKEEMAQKRLLAPYESSLIPLPHQILVLEKVMHGVQTRFLLADEVGMGKTIEAGLVIKEKKLRGELRRILLIVPKSAMLQWQQELKEHFNENFYIYDSKFISGMARTFADFDAEEELNFWMQHNQIIVSLDADAFPGEGMPSVEEIEPYVMRSEKRYAVDYDGNQLFPKRTMIRMDIALDGTKHHLQKQLYEDVTNYVRYQFGRAKRGNRNSTGLVMVMMQKLASSSTAAILGAMQTRLQRLRNGEAADDIDDYDEERDIDFDELEMGDYSVDTQNGAFVNEEDRLSELIEAATYCMKHEQDAKASALVDKIFKLKETESVDFKVLVFTEFRRTQIYLAELLKGMGLSVMSINGSMELGERQKALVEFKQRAQVMIATDAAGESLNMQFCHVVFNYDLPWNPMSIEQRIGRVDRIGQKHTVVAYNMLTDNTVDNRVYEVIVEKLDAILQELGIDKTSDVLDSTIDQQKVNHLYLQSLLDPKRFDFASDSWLYDIKSKLRNYKSTEGLLPTFKKEDIDKRSAGDVKYSPLPVWLEELVDLYTVSEHGTIDKLLDGTSEYHLNGKIVKAYYDASMQGNNPGTEYLTLQHPVIKRILDEVDGNSQTIIPVIKSTNGGETPGYLTLWKVSAKNEYETKTTYVAQFIADNGRVFAPYGNDIWNRLVQEKDSFSYSGETNCELDLESNGVLMNNLHAIFHRMETDIQNNLQIKAERKLKALKYVEHRLHRIGIENIRKAKLRKLQEQKDSWENAFAQGRSVVPDVKHILTVRIDG